MDFNTHRLLRAIDNNTLLSKLAEHQQAHPEEVMMPEDELEKYFELYPELIRNTRLLLDQCSIEFQLGSDKNKKHLTGGEKSDWELLV